MADRPLSSRLVKPNDGCLTEPSIDQPGKVHQKSISISAHEILKARVDNSDARREKELFALN